MLIERPAKVNTVGPQKRALLNGRITVGILCMAHKITGPLNGGGHK